MRRLAGLALLAALACNSDFEPQYRVTDLRILAVRARVAGSDLDVSGNPTGIFVADPNLDETLQLDALVANPEGRADLGDVDVTWLACAPGEGGQLPPCLDPTVLDDPDSLVSAGAFVIGKGPQPAPFDLSALPQDVRDAFQRALDAAVAQANQQPTYKCRVFVEIPIVVVARSATGRRDVALKRVRLVEVQPSFPDQAYKPNQNPVAEAITFGPVNPDGCTGGTDLAAGTAFPSGRTTLCSRWRIDAAPEPYDVCDAAGNPQATTETYGWQWYVTAGEFKDVGRIGNAEGTPIDFERAPAAFTMWLILRDGRGGVDWIAWTDPSP